MISITKEETAAVRKKFPNVHIRRTMHKYYMEENRAAVEYLKSRNSNREV